MTRPMPWLAPVTTAVPLGSMGDSVPRLAMDLRFTADQERFRAEARAWLTDRLDGRFAVVRGRGGPGDEHERGGLGPQHRLRLRRELEGAREAPEERSAHVLLQEFHLVAHRSGSDMELARGQLEALPIRPRLRARTRHHHCRHEV